MDLYGWVLIIIGIIIGALLYRSANKKEDIDELDDWDQQDQLEGDKTL